MCLGEALFRGGWGRASFRSFVGGGASFREMVISIIYGGAFVEASCRGVQWDARNMTLYMYVHVLTPFDEDCLRNMCAYVLVWLSYGLPVL